MRGDLSNGLRRLTVEGRQIVTTPSREPVLLRGLNRSGLEYSEPDGRGFLESAGISEAEISWMARDWGANIIRLPFNQDWILNGRGDCPPAAYLEALDQVIFWASRAGAYTLLDLQWLDADVVRGHNPDGSPNRVPSLPTLDSLAAWRTLAVRYREEPAVLFDLFNEPHDPIAADPTVLEGIREDGTLFPLEGRRVTMAEWQPWARQLVREIRREHARSLIFVSGVSWAYDLRGMPLTIAAGSSEHFADLVYSTHVYPWCGNPGWSLRGPWPVGPRALTWKEAFGRLARVAPVFVAEWGGGSAHVGWGETLVRYLRRLGVGWAAWSWSDAPRLVVDAQAQRYEPTRFGSVVRRALIGEA
jgi:hypothetical protein